MSLSLFAAVAVSAVPRTGLALTGGGGAATCALMATGAPGPAPPSRGADGVALEPEHAPEPAPEAALIARAMAGERSALRELVDLLTPTIQERAVRALFRRRRAAGDRDVRQEVEDMTQTVFLSLFSDGGRTLRQWDGARGLSLPGFVGLVAEREVTSILRSRRRNPWTEAPTEDDTLDQGVSEAAGPEPAMISRDTFEAIARRLRERLSERGLELFYLLLVDERSTEDVCAITGMTADAVYAWRSRLARQVRAIAAELATEAEPAARTSPQGTSTPRRAR
ncbi:hypothetical protein WMF37_01640 [Sorangium sp. So ce291]|uniref:RNA polymerase sigma factor n=1 Tax=Sorangium sp. So ce291 TaxID=3133294 RepID=UPI003F5EC97B